MARDSAPNDPYAASKDARVHEAPVQPILSEPAGPSRAERAAEYNGAQIDPELAEGPASGGRIAMYAVAIVVVLGAVFYGLNNTSAPPEGKSATATQSAPPTPAATSSSGTKAAQTSPAPGQSAASNTSPSNAPNTTPNSTPGTTTATAPAQAQQTKSGPTGTEVDRSKGGSTAPAQ